MKIFICNNINEINFTLLDMSSVQDFLIILQKSSWNDFGYKVTFDLYIMNIIGFSYQRKIGQLKIAKEFQSILDFSDLEEYNALTSSLNDELPELFYSLGENSNYYQDIKDYFNNPVLELSLLRKLKDINNDRNKLTSLENQIVFEKAFKRTTTYTDKLETDWFNNISEPKSIFDNQIQNARDLLQNITVTETIAHSFYSMIFGYVIAAMENYLFTIFSKKINSDISNQISFAKSIKINFKLSDCSSPNFFNDTILNQIKNISFHNIANAKDLFKEHLNHNLMTDEQSQYFISSVQIRHDCAHRGGYNLEGIQTVITRDQINELIDNVCAVIENTESNL